jgi:hypothetical protein
MALETAGYLSDLVITNPPANDPLAQAADHLRLIKASLKTTFPNLNAAVTASPADLNLTATLATDLAGKLSLTGGTMTGDLIIDGADADLDVVQGRVKQAGHDVMPIGTVIHWYGDIANKPTGFVVADGLVHNGQPTPDLRSVFLRGTNGTGVSTATGGSDAQTTSSEGNHTHTGTAANAGSHSHGGTSGATALTAAQIPAHTHFIAANENNTGTTIDANAQLKFGWPFGNEDSAYQLRSSNLAATMYKTSSVGSGQGHTHTIATAAAGTHSHTVSVDPDGAHTHTIDNRPVFAELHILIRVY